MRKSDAMKHFLRHRLKSNSGSLAMKLRVWDALRNLKELVQNSKPKLLRMKSLLMSSKPKLPMLKNQRVDWVQTLMIFQWNMNVSMPLLCLPRSVQRILTRSLVNGCPKLMMSKLKLLPPKMKEGIIAQSCSACKQLRMKLLSNLILSNARIRISLMKSKISLTNLEKEDALFMILINSAVDWKQKRRSYKLH